MFTFFWTEDRILQPFVMFYPPSEVNCFDSEFQKSWQREHLKSLSVDKAMTTTWGQTAWANSFRSFKPMYLFLKTEPALLGCGLELSRWRIIDQWSGKPDKEALI